MKLKRTPKEKAGDNRLKNSLVNEAESSPSVRTNSEDSGSERLTKEDRKSVRMSKK